MKTKQNQCLSLLFVISISLALTGCQNQLPVVDNGIAKICIVAGAADEDLKAAQELAIYIQKMSGVKVEIVKDSVVRASAIYVGNSSVSDSLKTLLTHENVGYDGYIVSPVKNGLAIIGRNGGTMHAVYDLLYQWGCRFYMPGELGEYIPKLKKISVNLKMHFERPGMDSRIFATSANEFGGPFGGSNFEWLAKNKTGGIRYDHFHAFARLLPPSKYFSSHPEYFALINGKRVSTTACTNNPEVIKIIIEAVRQQFEKGEISASVSMNDTDETCECKDCVAERRGLEGSVNLMALANKVALALEKEYPDRYIFLYANYVFNGYLPENFRIAKNVVPVWFPLSGGHNFNDKTCPIKVEKLKALKDWKRAGAKQIGLYDYLNLHEIEYPITKSLNSQMKIASDNNCIAGHFETDNRSWVNNLSIYLAARLMWNPKEDIDPVVTEYFNLLYGKAAKPMRKYYDALENLTSTRNPDIHNETAVYKNMTPKVQSRLRDYLKDAMDKAENDLYRKRVDAAIVNFEQDILVVNLENIKQKLIKSESDEDRIAVVEGEAKLEEYRSKYARYNLPVSTVNNYNDTEDSKPKRTDSILMIFPQFWKFTRDIKLEGEKENWLIESFDDSKWLPISTWKWWEDQGYPGYDGVAWYRLKFRLPETVKSTKGLVLHFGAVDDHAWVYINGKLAGAHAKGGLYWDEPFDIPAGDFLYANKENTISIKVLDVGSKGGIFRKIWLVKPTGKNDKLSKRPFK